MTLKTKLLIGLVIMTATIARYALTYETPIKASPPNNQQAVIGIRDMVKGLQRAVGAEQDGIIGYETMAKVNEAVKKEQRELFNSYAEKSMQTREMTFEDLNKVLVGIGQ